MIFVSFRFLSVRRYVLYRSVLVLHSSILYHGSNQTPMMAVDDNSVLAAELDAGALVAELAAGESRAVTSSSHTSAMVGPISLVISKL